MPKMDSLGTTFQNDGGGRSRYVRQAGAMGELLGYPDKPAGSALEQLEVVRLSTAGGTNLLVVEDILEKSVAELTDADQKAWDDAAHLYQISQYDKDALALSYAVCLPDQLKLTLAGTTASFAPLTENALIPGGGLTVTSPTVADFGARGKYAAQTPITLDANGALQSGTLASELDVQVRGPQGTVVFAPGTMVAFSASNPPIVSGTLGGRFDGQWDDLSLQANYPAGLQPTGGSHFAFLALKGTGVSVSVALDGSSAIFDGAVTLEDPLTLASPHALTYSASGLLFFGSTEYCDSGQASLDATLTLPVGTTVTLSRGTLFSATAASTSPIGLAISARDGLPRTTSFQPPTLRFDSAGFAFDPAGVALYDPVSCEIMNGNEEEGFMERVTELTRNDGSTIRLTY
jgi:hypothetical protein